MNPSRCLFSYNTRFLFIFHIIVQVKPLFNTLLYIGELKINIIINWKNEFGKTNSLWKRPYL